MDFNAIGRDMHVRYPAFDLVFRLDDGQHEIKPDSLASFRLGLVDQRLPAIWGGWQHNGLLYKVSVMTIPSAEQGNFDLYKLQIQNPTSAPIPSQLAATIEGPPDMRVEEGVVRGLGDAPFLLVDPNPAHERVFRDWGLCDKRAKSYTAGAGPGKTEAAVASYRVGLAGLPVSYRFRAEPGKKYLVYLVSTPHIAGYLLETPEKPGDLVFEYQVEGLDPQTLDWVEYTRAKQQPLCVRFDGVATPTAMDTLRYRPEFRQTRHQAHAAERHLRTSAGNERSPGGGCFQWRHEFAVRVAHRCGRHTGAGPHESGL